ncbi:MAG: hypothetical protein PUA57_07285 [Eggerthellales bacterium]|nr:hypothetical protein [Eggerthellales bacterium]
MYERFPIAKSFAQRGFSGETALDLRCANDSRRPFRSHNDAIPLCERFAGCGPAFGAQINTAREKGARQQYEALLRGSRIGTSISREWRSLRKTKHIFARRKSSPGALFFEYVIPRSKAVETIPYAVV